MSISNQDFVSEVIFEESPRDFFIMIPHIVLEMLETGELSSSAFALYSVLRKIAGERGACWIGQRGLQKKTGQDAKTIIKNKKILSKPFASLGGKSLIKIIPGNKKKELADTIVICNIWIENHKRSKEIATWWKNSITPGGKIPSQEEPSKKKEQQQEGAIAPVAVSSEKTKKGTKIPLTQLSVKTAQVKKPRIHSCLEKTDIPDMHKARLTKRYTEEIVQKALDFVLAPDFEIKTTLTQALYWHCKERPLKRENKASKWESHKAYATKYEFEKSGNDGVEIWPDYVLIYNSKSSYSFTLGFDEKGFMDKFKSELRKREFKILEE